MAAEQALKDRKKAKSPKGGNKSPKGDKSPNNSKSPDKKRAGKQSVVADTKTPRPKSGSGGSRDSSRANTPSKKNKVINRTINSGI